MPTLFATGTTDILANVQVDQKTGEYHSASSKITQFASESGALLNDHIILNPDTLEMAFIIENQDPNYGAYGQRASTELDKLKNIQQARQPVDVLTRHYLYKSMIITHITCENSSPFIGRLTGRVGFQQFNRITIQQVTLISIAPVLAGPNSTKQVLKGVTITALLDVRMQPGDRVRVESSINPDLNRDYVIQKCQLTGSSHSDQWTTKIESFIKQ